MFKKYYFPQISQASVAISFILLIAIIASELLISAMKYFVIISIC